MDVNDAFYSRSFQEVLDKLTPPFAKFLMAEQEYLLDFVDKEDSLLEVGCGTARLAKVLASHVAHFTGLDYSQIQLEEAVKNTSQFRKGVTLVSGDARSVPFPGAWYDLVVVAFNTINSLNEPAHDSKLQVVKEAYRLLVPEGRLFVSVWDENASEAQLEFYASLGFNNKIEVTDNYVLVKDNENRELLSGRSSADELESLLSAAGFVPHVERLTGNSYAATGVRH